MTNYSQYKLGDWIPEERGYLKKCPICIKSFTGRRNRVYCSDICHNDNSNKNAFEKRVKLKPLFKMVGKTYCALEKCYPMSLGKPISIFEVNGAGFDGKCPSTPVALLNRPGEWNVLLDYAYQIDPNSNTITIIKLM